MTQTDNQVRGKAVYLEFTNGANLTLQVLIMPEGIGTSHKVVPMTMYRRRISTVQPRKTWKISAAYTTASQASAFSQSSEEKVTGMLSFTQSLFHSLQINGYKLYRDPIVVEVTAEDLEAARTGKTPYKAMARVWKVRKTLGYPKEYIHGSEYVAPEPVATSSPAPAAFSS